MAIYAKIENGEVTQYPLYEGDLQREHPEYIYPLDANEEANNGLIAPEGYVRIVHTQPVIPDVYYRLIEEYPVLTNGEWVQTWRYEPMTAEEQETYAAELAYMIREQRNALLKKSDEFVVADRWEYYSAQTKKEWADYRQGLRDITDQVNFPKSVDWPIEPSVFVINSF